MEKIIHRVCSVCGKNKRTTVSEFEQAVFICEKCLRGDIYNKAVEGLSTWKPFVYIILILIVGMVLGYFIGKI